MKNKIIVGILSLFLIFLIACQQAAKEPVMEKKEDAMQKTEAPATTGEAAVDAVGNDLTNVNTVEKDLSADELSDLDAGLIDVQNI